MSQKITIESVAKQLLENGKSAEETLLAIQRVFPGCKTSMKCIYYYSSKYKIGLSSKQVVDMSELKKLGLGLSSK